MFQFKGTIIRSNMKTQYWYIQTVHTLWDPYCLQTVLTLKHKYKLLADVFKMYICMRENQKVKAKHI